MPLNKKVVFLPYDMDTALGINNEGELVFGYSLEDTDHIGNDTVYNGQDSVLWNNVRETFGTELGEMYRQLRSSGKLSYAKVEQMFTDHQAKWPAAIFNEDAYFKYLAPLFDDNDEQYLKMLLGSKAEQRKWWLYNRFRYMDSKYNAGDALTDLIVLRLYAHSTITITPYADIYATIKWGARYTRQRAFKNTAYPIECPLPNPNDVETAIYSASQLASVGDLSGFNVGYADFSKAIRLTELILGSNASGYQNTNLRSLNIGNLKLLKKIDVRNCVGLGTANEMYSAQRSVDLSGCDSIEEVYFDGTSIANVALPNGGFLKKLHLPATIANLTIRNQTQITEFVLPDYSNISTLFLENTSNIVDIAAIMPHVAERCRVRLFNFRWNFASIAAVHEFLDLFDGMRGIDQNGDDTETAQIFATVHVPTANGDEIESVTNRYPDITVDADVATYYVKYYNWEGDTLLYTETVQKGQNGTYSSTPSHTATPQYTFSFAGWNTRKNSTTAEAGCRDNVHSNLNLYAAYTTSIRTYTIQFVRAAEDGGGTLQTGSVSYGATPVYNGATPTSSNNDGGIYTFSGWTPEIAPVTGNQTYTATFEDSTIVLIYMNGNTVMRREHMSAGGNGTGAGSTPTKAQTAQYTYTFLGWSTDSTATTADSNALNNVTENRTVYAIFSESLRQYTITFVKAQEDGGGTITTKQVAYGTVPTYTDSNPTSSRQGYEFIGWSPTLTTVTGNATYTAQFSLDASKTRAMIKRSITVFDNSSITTIGSHAFRTCISLTAASGSSVEVLSDMAFNGCTRLGIVSFPNLITIGNSAFGGCTKIVEASFPNLTTVSSYAFCNCSSLSTVSLPAATRIGASAFSKCTKLENIYIPLVSVVGQLAFENCKNIQTMSLPAIESLGKQAFNGCSSLTALILDNISIIASIASNTFVNTNTIIYVADNLVSDYQSASYWSTISSRIKGISELQI